MSTLETYFARTASKAHAGSYPWHTVATAIVRVPLGQAHLREVVDDDAGKTIVSVHDAPSEEVKGTPVERAMALGKLLGERAVAAGVKTVVFDRGSYAYHGRVKALAEGAREAGLTF